MSRARPGLRAPGPGDGAAIPVTRLGPAVDLYRAQSRSHPSPWHYSCRNTPGSGGRFDLDCTSGRGTSYWSATPVAAILEAVSDPDAPDPTVVTVGALRRMAVWHVSALPSGTVATVADLRAPRAVPRLTGEVNTTWDYALTQQWAAAVARAGRGGAASASRFANAAAVALFVEAGASYPANDVGTARPGIDHWSDLPAGMRATTRDVGHLDDLQRAPPPPGRDR